MRSAPTVLLTLMFIAWAIPCIAQKLELKDPAGIGAYKNLAVVVSEKQLIRWDGENSATLVEDVTATAKLDEVSMLTVQSDGKVLLLGKSGSAFRVAAFKINFEEPETPAEYVEGLSRDLDLGDTEAVTCIAEWNGTLFFATKSGETSTVYRIAVGAARLGKLRTVASIDGVITAAAMSPHGHVATVVDSGTSVDLVYLQPESGQALLRLGLAAEDVASMDFSVSGQLYAACTKTERRGIYRLEAYFKKAKQAVRCIEVANSDGLKKIACGEDGLCVGLALDDDRWRLIQLKGTK